MIHDGIHLLHAVFALKCEVAQGVLVVAILFVQDIDGIDERHALFFVVGSHFADDHAAVHGVLIAHIAAGEVAVALFEQVALRVSFALKQSDLVADILEAGEGTANFNAVILRDAVDHIGGNNRRDRDRVLRHGAELRFALCNKVQEQNAHFVAGHEHILAVLVDGDAYAVTVRIGREQQVGLYGLAEIKAFLECFADFRIRVRAGGEVAVRLALLRHNGDILHADAVEDAQHAHFAAAVERGVDELEVIRRLTEDAHAVNRVDERVDGLFANIFRLAGSARLLKRDFLHVRENIERFDLRHNAVCHAFRYLAAVVAVGLIAVVLCRVVACGNADACITVQVTHSEGQRRGRHKLRVEVRLDAVCGEHRCGLFGE